MSIVPPEEATHEELVLLNEEFFGAVLAVEEHSQLSAGALIEAVQTGRTKDILPLVMRNRGARAVFEQARRGTNLGYSHIARAANTLTDGVRRMVGATEMRLIPDGPRWQLVLTLPKGATAVPKMLIVSGHVNQMEHLGTLDLNEPIDGHIMQTLDLRRQQLVFDLLLEPSTQISLH